MSGRALNCSLVSPFASMGWSTPTAGAAAANAAQMVTAARFESRIPLPF